MLQLFYSNIIFSLYNLIDDLYIGKDHYQRLIGDL